jgi:O-Antigen ligase
MSLKNLKYLNIPLLTVLFCAVAFMYPFNQLYMYWGLAINIPYADLLIIIASFVGVVALLQDWQKKKSLLIDKQVWKNFVPLVFLLFVGIFSLTNIWSEQLLVSIKYWWRFVAFYYIFYFLFLQVFINNEKRYWKISWCLYFLGIFLSIMGIVSFILPEVSHAFRMATPLSWFGLFPHGASHNLLAEALVSIILFSWLLVYRYQSREYSKWLYLGLAIMIGVVLLTFSRTGWLVLWLELFILSAIYFKTKMRVFLQKYWWVGLALLAILMVYFITFGQTNFVTSSNEARVAMIEKSVYLFQDHPWVGNGIGTWQEIVGKDIYFVYEFGEPLEQHGVIWKLMAEQGILGVIVWLGMMGYFLAVLIKNYRQFQNNNPWRWGALVAVLVVFGQFVFQLLDTGYYSSKMWLPLGLAFALMYISKKYLNLQNNE